MPSWTGSGWLSLMLVAFVGKPADDSISCETTRFHLARIFDIIVFIVFLILPVIWQFCKDILQLYLMNHALL